MHKCVDIGGGLIAYILSKIATDHENEKDWYLRGRPVIIDHKYVHSGHGFLGQCNLSRRNAKWTSDRQKILLACCQSALRNTSYSPPNYLYFTKTYYRSTNI